MDTIKVTTDSGKFVIKTPFHLNGLVRTVPGARWSNPRKAYVAPFSRKAAEMLSHIKAPIEFDKSAIELMAQAVKASEKIVREPFPAWYSFKTKPMPHQQRALNYIWGMKEFALFMGMRTGKTKTIIDLACALKMAGLIDHALIIPPISVRHEWTRQVAEHAPIPLTTGNFDLTTQSGRKKCTAFFESPDEFKMMLVGVESFSAGQAYDWAVDFIRSHGRVLTLIDESQNIKNHRGVRTDKITELGLISEYKGIMTGTPTGKDVLDLYAQFYFLNPDIIGYSDYWSFRNRYAVFGGYENKQIIGFNNVEELMTAIKPYTFQVTTEEAAPDLPPKQYIQRTVQMPAHIKTVYNSLTKHKLVMYNGEELHMKSSLERTLRQSMLVNGIMVTGKEGVYKQHHENSAKLAELAAVIEEYTLPTIIWGTLDAEIDRICEHLTSLGKTWTVIDGRVAKEERPNREKQFQSGQVDYLVAKAGVGGVGLCFDRAEVMVYMSNSFKYIDRKQSEERATNVHKGKGGVLIIDIIMEDSVDDKIIIPAMMAKEDVSQYIKKHMSNTMWGDDKESKDEQIL